MIARKNAALYLVLLFCAIAVVYTAQVSQQLASSLFLVPPFLAVVVGAHALRTYRLTSMHGQVVAILTAGLLCLFIGEVLFYLHQFVWHSQPFPSWADVFYLAAYPLLLMGFVKEIRLHKVSWQNFDKLILILISLLLLAVSLIVVYFGVYLAYSADETWLYNAISIAYGVADLVLIIPVLFILKIALDYRGGKLFNSWILMLFAIITMMTADILFAIYEDHYSALDWPYTLIDMFWVASYLLFAYSFYYTAASIREAHSKLLR